MDRGNDYFFRSVSIKSGLPVSTIKRVFKFCVETGKDIVMDGDEWKIGNMGRLVPVLGDNPEVSIQFIPSSSFSKDIETKFVENREVEL